MEPGNIKSEREEERGKYLYYGPIWRVYCYRN